MSVDDSATRGNDPMVRPPEPPDQLRVVVATPRDQVDESVWIDTTLSPWPDSTPFAGSSAGPDRSLGLPRSTTDGQNGSHAIPTNGHTPVSTSGNGASQTPNGVPSSTTGGAPPPYQPEPERNGAAEDERRLFRSAPPRETPRRQRRGWGVRTALITLLRQQRRMLLSVIAVALGVGYLAGSLSLLQRVGAGLAAQSGEATEQADLVVEGSIADDGPFQQNRRLVSDTLVQLLKNVPGVAAVEPRLESPSMLIIGLDGQPVVGFGLTERPLGANYPKDKRLNPYRFLGEGRAPETPTEVAIDQRSARAAKTQVGSQVLIASKNSVGTYTVTGILDLSEAQLPSGSSLALFETEAARPLFDTGADDNAIALRLEPGASIEQVRKLVSAQLYSGAEVSTGAEYSKHRQAALGKSFTMIRILLIGFAGLALVVGAFTVANSMALLFDHRRKGFAMLRLLGASPGQLVGAASLEALIGGLIAGVAGLVLGLGIGWAIERLIQSMGTPLPVVGSALTWWIPVVAVVVGTTVTLATALSPARAAARTPPVHAVTGIETRPGDRSSTAALIRSVVLLVLCALGFGAIGLIIGNTQTALLVGGIGLAIALVLVVLPRILSGIVSLTTRALIGPSVALRRMSALRSRQARTRAASTTAALLLASAVVTGLSVLSTSFVASVDDQVTKSITADLVVDSGSFTTGGLSSNLITKLRAMAGVGAVTSYRPGLAQIGARNWRAGGLLGSDALKLLDLDVVGTAPTSFSLDEVLVSQRLAETENITTGQVVPVVFPAGAVIEMKVKAVFRSRLNLLLGDVIVDTSVMAKQLPTSKDFLALLDLKPGAPKTTLADITRVSKESGAANVLPPAKLISTRAELLRGFSRVIQWMLAFSVILALIGVANTLQLGVNERRRELGLLRAVGATKAQVLRLVMAEAAALSLVGTVVGMLAGLAAAYGTVSALADYGLDQFVTPNLTLIVVAVIAVGLGLVGAVFPALRATQIPVLEAIADSSDNESSRRHRKRRDGEVAVAAGPAASTPPPFHSPTQPPRLTDHPQQPAPAFPPEPADDFAHDVPPDTENTMAMRCYNCGNEPGDGPSCAVCGATQISTPVSMFGLRADASTAPTESDAGHEAPIATATLSDVYNGSGGDGDFVEDAVIIEDTIDAPPPMEGGRHSLGSIFDERPDPRTMGEPERSPFGQHAVERELEDWEEEWEDAQTSAPEADDVPPSAPWPGPTTPPPAYVRQQQPSYESAPYAGATYQAPAAGYGAVPTYPAAANNPPQPAERPIEPDAFGLSSAISRLSAQSRESANVAFSVVGALLEPSERVLGAVAGSSLGMPTVVVVTERRALIVSDRRFVPEVERFDLGPDLKVYGRHANGQASLTFGDGERLVTVDQIADVGVAVELAGTARNRTSGTLF